MKVYCQSFPHATSALQTAAPNTPSCPPFQPVAKQQDGTGWKDATPFHPLVSQHFFPMKQPFGSYTSSIFTHAHTPKYHIKLVLHPDMFFLSPLTYPTTQSKINVPRSISRSRNIISYHIHHVSHIPKHTTIKYSFPYTIAIKVYTEVSSNMGTPKSSILIGCSIINHDNPL